MSVRISVELEPFVDREIANGNFADRDDIVNHALRLLQRDREEAIVGIKAGLADVAAGRVQPLDEAFDELRRESGVSKGA